MVKILWQDSLLIFPYFKKSDKNYTNQTFFHGISNYSLFSKSFVGSIIFSAQMKMDDSFTKGSQWVFVVLTDN